MSNDLLFRNLCTNEVMKIGWHLAEKDSRDDFLSDPIGYADFASSLTERVQHLVEEIRSQRYRPRHLTEVEVPKSGLSVRPGNVLPIEESTVLHAITYLLAPHLDRKLAGEVFSYRLHVDWKRRVAKGKSLFRDDDRELPFLKGKTIRKFDPIEPWYSAWPEFQTARANAFKVERYTHMTKTDITAYFENIDLRLLESQLQNLMPRETKLLSVLMRILEAWTRVTSTGIPVGRGIPQGNDASSFLANLYLLPMDKALSTFCRKRNAKWNRYVDDVEVYTHRYSDARDVVFVITTELRALHLNLQGSKTNVLFGARLKRELDDSELQALETAWKVIEKLDCRDIANQRKITSVLNSIRPIVRKFRRRLPDGVRNLTNKQNRVLRRAMTIYGRCGRPWLKAAAFAALEELPEYRMLKKCLRYLGQLPYREHDEIVERLFGLLDRDVLAIPYQAAMVIDTLRWLHPRNPTGIGSRIRQFCFRRSRHDWLIKQKTAEAIATFPYIQRHAASLAHNFLGDANPWVRRGACVLLARADVQTVRQRVNTLLFHPDRSVSRLALLWSRYIGDKQYSLTEIGRLKNGSVSDHSFIFRLPTIWILRCNPDRDVVSSLRQYLELYERSKSEKVRWQIRALKSLTEWTEDA
jgi:Reverse transcriptase (RNA-dependent DNA polymerase)